MRFFGPIRSIIFAVFSVVLAAGCGRTPLPAVGAAGALSVALKVSPAELRLAVGMEAQLTVTAVLSSMEEIDVTSGHGTTYAFDTNGFMGAKPAQLKLTQDGRVTALQAGGTTIRVQYQTLTAVVQVVVTDKLTDVVGISIEPKSPSIEIGGTVQLTVRVKHADGSTTDAAATGLALTWQDSAPMTASVDASGLVKGLAVGTARIRVDLMTCASPLCDFTDFADISVRPPESQLVRIEVEPTTLSMRVGQSQQLRVTVFFSDGTSTDASGPPTQYLAMSIGGAFIVSPTGLVMGLARGDGLITIAYPGLMPVTVTVKIDDVTTNDYVALAIIAPSQLMVGESQPFQVIATRRDGTVEDVTGRPELSVVTSNPSILSLNGMTIHGESPGRAAIQARFMFLTATLPVVVVAMPDRVVGLEWHPSALMLSVGGRAPISLLAHYASGATIDVSLDPQAMEAGTGPIRLERGANGLVVVALAPGMATIQGAYGGFLATAEVTIADSADYVRLFWQPMQVSLRIGDAISLSLLAVRSDGTVENVTLDPRTMLSPMGEGQVFATNPNPPGLQVRGLNAGMGGIAARFLSLSAGLPITVTGLRQLVGIRVEPPNITLRVGATAQLRVFAVYSDGSISPLMGAASFASRAPGVASVSPAGAVRAIAPGTAVIQAMFMQFTAYGTVRVTGLPPVITRLTPNPIRVGSPTTTLIVSGMGFEARSQVLINGFGFLATTYVSATEVRITLPAILLRNPLMLRISVRNPSSGLESNVILLTIRR